MTKKPTTRRAARSAALPSDPTWFKDAVIYELHVRSFMDGNGDGIGDFKGLTSKLDYLKALGVNTLWLLPFYPSPLKDDGYDIADFFKVNPHYGTLLDFQRFLTAAHAKGLRVITELVVNHTSDQHPWFQRARKAKKGSPERNFYVWSDDQKRYSGVRIIFRDSEAANWTWDEVAKQYYWHRFFSHQPDLNYDNPAVQEAIFGVMDFWMGMGVDGMRLDAVPYLFEREGTSCENLPEGHDFLRKLRQHLDSLHQDKMLLGEACQWPEDTVPYFGKGDEVHMNFHFPVMPRLYMALASEDRTSILDILAQTPPIPASCQWATFLRNHDELTLEMVTEEERVWMWQTYAKDPRAKINLGIRRRLAPLLDGDQRKIDLMSALLLALPGTPVLYYGDEIGMGDDLSMPDRFGLRTPMQWDDSANGGFSTASPNKLTLKPIATAGYHWKTLNVASQWDDLDSPLQRTIARLRMRQQAGVFGRGSIRFFEPDNRAILAFTREHAGATVLALFNLSRESQAFTLDLREHQGLVPVDLATGARWPALRGGTHDFTLARHGFFWLQLADAKTLQPLTSDCDAQWLQKQRWFGAKGRTLRSAVAIEASDLSNDGAWSGLRLVEIQCDFGSGPADSWLSLQNLGADATDDPALGKKLLEILLTQKKFANKHGTKVQRNGATDTWWLRGEVTRALRPKDLAKLPPCKRITGEQSNTSLLFGEQAILKLVRKLETGENPDFEVPRFLRERTEFAHCAAPLGLLRMHRPFDGECTIGVLHAYVPNIGDAWRCTLGKLAEIRKSGPSASWRTAIERVEETTPLLQRLGKRVGQLHLALASDRKDPAFAPEAFTPFYQRGLWQSLRNLVRSVWSQAPTGMNLPSEAEVLQGFAALRTITFSAERIRTHGDLHLGQVLITPDQDCVLIDFEGEPMKPLAERRLKRSPLRDVAGIVRSLHYASAVARHEGEADASLSASRQDGYAAWLEGWRTAAVAAFLESWFTTVEGSALVPAQRADADALLAVFVLEKAVYELGYEIGHRPTWVPIPLAGIRAVLKGES